MRFGLLSYQTYNLGDFIQSVAARKFLPTVDQFIDREALHEAPASDGKPIKLIMNGWFCQHPDKWPPAAVIEPLLISLHITNIPQRDSGMRPREEFARMPQVLRYLRRNGPVGARDHDTLAWLKSFDIEAYFSGCLTLTLDRPAVPREPFIALSDAPDSVASRVESTTDCPLRRTTHTDTTTVGVEARLKLAIDLIELYARASCVVTTRLHAALPCLAIGTPVLLVDTGRDQSRFPGLADLVHHCSVEHFISGEFDYDVGKPPSNPAKHLCLRNDLIKRVAAFTSS